MLMNMGSVSDSISGADYRKNKKKITVADIISAAVFVLIAVYLLMHLRNGIGLPDESFYLTVPQRIFNGDGLVSSEWHVTQFSSFAQYPFYALFRFVTGSTDGIILFFRVLYVFFS